MPTNPRRRGSLATLALLTGVCTVLASAPTAAAGAAATGGALGAAAPGASAADTRPPTPPTNLRSTRLTCQSVTLAWSASRDDVGVTAYDIYHDGQLVTSVAGGTLTATLTVAQGVTWGWYVNARDAAGNVSQASATLTVTPPFCQSDTQRPSTPTNLAATANGTDVRLTWSASTDNVAVTRYDILRDGRTVGSVTGTAGSPPVTSFTDTGLTVDTTFRYTVTARDAQGNASPASAAVSVRTGSACTSAVCATTVVTTERDLPWGLVQLPDGTVLYGRRDLFDIVAMRPDGTGKTSVGTVPGVAGTNGEGGVLGLAVAPTFNTDRWLYVYHTTSTDNRIVRMRYTDTLQTSSAQVLVSGIPRNKYHNGGRLRFGPDGMLYAATGDGQTPDRAQDVTDLAGKVLRIRPDGGVPADNPFGNPVWSYGHRNPQGLAFDSRGRLFAQEFGNNAMDETNIIVRGGNYGWPACEGTVGDCANPNFTAPVRTYPVADASCSGIAIVRDALYLACLRGNRMYRFQISGDTLTGGQQFFVGTYSRLRTVEPTLDGNLWLTTSTGGDKDSVPNNSNERILKVTLG
ncbi:PQQ-dependent sugar dehydrogenase [Micromonospora sp. WMMA1923]|uniref:PQQ-dependent sugar dehydrogenase n=1 Tax=Micromonospora sp. WMMA1923 TaxID=3404125 RepID=UPI003B9616BA